LFLPINEKSSYNAPSSYSGRIWYEPGYSDQCSKCKFGNAGILIKSETRIYRRKIDSGVTTGRHGLQNAEDPGWVGGPLGPLASELHTLKIYISANYNYLKIFIYYDFFI
jgi:hypothetical protein